MGTPVDWLLRSDEPAIRWHTRRDLLDDIEATEPVLDGPKMGALFDGQQDDGGFGTHPYSKWGGAHWRLVSMVELGVPPGEPRAVKAAGTVLDWLSGDDHRSQVARRGDRVLRCASQEGNALAVSCRLGLTNDPRVGLLARSLVEWQWPDGGWNCDHGAGGHRSSFHESLPPMWGLFEYWRATGDEAAHRASLRTAELLLDHRIVFSLTTGELIKKEFAALHYPPYWHYDVLQALLVLSRMGLAADPRCSGALDLLERRRRSDGRWRPGGYWWKAPGPGRGSMDPVDWGRSAPNEMITLNALRVLKSAGRW